MLRKVISYMGEIKGEETNGDLAPSNVFHVSPPKWCLNYKALTDIFTTKSPSKISYIVFSRLSTSDRLILLIYFGTFFF